MRYLFHTRERLHRFSHSFYYANAHQFSEEVLALVNGADSNIDWFCVDAVAIDDIDYSAAATLRATIAALKEKGVRLVLLSVDADVKVALDHFGITELVAADGFFATGADVLSAYHKRKQ